MTALRPHIIRQARTRRTRYAAPALEKGLDILELLASISEPIFNQHREAIAAMTVPFLAHIGDRVGPPQARAALCAASQALSSAIGGDRLELTSGALP